MKQKFLKPFIRKNLDILFVALNPSFVSNKKMHYFSKNQSFWNQLYKSQLIVEEVDKDIADDKVFGSNLINFNNWNYGIIDIVPNIVQSNSSSVRVNIEDCVRLKNIIIEYSPKIVVIMHSKVLDKFIFRYLNIEKQISNSGRMGKLIQDCDSIFYNIAFPHGNKIKKERKIENYILVRGELDRINRKCKI